MNCFKKVARITAATLAIVIAAATTSFATTYPCAGYVSGTGVNLRSGPDTTHGVYEQMTYGTPVNILAKEGNWYKVSTPLAACGYAYLSADYVGIGEAPQITKQAGGATGSVSAGQRVVQIAEQFLGLPYVYGGSTPAGFDCSGFTSYVYKQMGYTLNRVSADQIYNGIPVSKSELLPGDIILFKKKNATRIHHVGIYVGNGMMIHSPQTGDVIKYASIVNGYYNDCYYAARRIIQ
ncbi:MAG: C40 family peptidase [Clostridia bacterium]|nr:C40 family peptidase [Clostridia bacterium]